MSAKVSLFEGKRLLCVRLQNAVFLMGAVWDHRLNDSREAQASICTSSSARFVNGERFFILHLVL